LCSIWVINALNDVYPHWWGWISLLSFLIQILISCRNTPRDTLRSNGLPAIWSSQIDILKLATIYSII
jgi:hypothetical protein